MKLSGSAIAASLSLALLALGLTACGDGGGESGDATASPAVQRTAKLIRGFGSEAGGERAKQAEAALHGYLDASVEQRWSDACSHLSAPFRRSLAALAAQAERIEPGNCAGVIKLAIKKLPMAQRAALTAADVGSVRLEDGQGYVVYADSNGAEYGMPIELDAGRVGVAGTAGTPLG
ncbi:MAG TPA: hypothetical protein VFT19_07260 [Solirubrobacterales bacterium]|nr:hypothetical protein [Solirubrobacterales bacterium]